MSKIVILDLDNTISDDSHRIPLIDWSREGRERYDAYHRACLMDKCDNRHLFTNQPHTIVIFTGRPEYLRNETKLWLARNQVPFTALFMRKDDEHGISAPVLKLQMLDQLLTWCGGTDSIAAAYDDHEGVIRAYQLAGLHAERWFIHDDATPYKMEGRK